MEAKTINIIKICADLMLMVIILICLYQVITYRVEVSEALGFNNYDRLLNIYEKETGWKCYCGYEYINNSFAKNEFVEKLKEEKYNLTINDLKLTG